MNTNLLALIYSVLFVFAVVAVAFVIKALFKPDSESIRKFIHILVSNWVFFLVYMFDDVRYAVLGPLAFIVINSIFVFGGFGKYLGMGDRKRDNGLIYFPISLLLLTFMYFKGMIGKEDILAGVLIMGYGDGLAAIVGKRFGKNKYSYFSCKKSIEGSATMFLVAMVIALLLGQNLPVAVTMALVATVFEGVTPLGLDNITVPLLTAITGALL